MFKSLSVILSFSILLQSVNIKIDDFDKIPNLFNHLTQHLEQGDSFIEFFSMHYGCELKNHKNEHKEHQKLPFKHQNLDGHIQLVLIPSFFKISNFELKTFHKKSIFYYAEPLAHLFSNYIFQPPRTA